MTLPLALLLTAIAPAESADRSGLPAAIKDCEICPAVRPLTVNAAVKSSTQLYMTIYPITWRQYLLAVKAANCPFPANLNGKPVETKGLNLADDYPVTGVAVDDFNCYVEWLNRSSGKNYRLPTPSEWLAAARTGPTKMENWSILDRGHAMSRDRNDPRDTVKSGSLRPVGMGSPSKDGIFDLEGNGGEATNEARAGPNPKICAQYGERYCRGVRTMGFNETDGSLRTDQPTFSLAGYPDISVGYRLVRSAATAQPGKGQRK